MKEKPHAHLAIVRVRQKQEKGFEKHIPYKCQG